MQRICDLGVGRQVLLWFKNYLSGHIHRVKAGDQYSDWGSICAGIPQGNALGPLLFLIYVNSLPSQVTDGVLLQYADDIATAEVMNQQLQLVHDWTVLIQQDAVEFSKVQSNVVPCIFEETCVPP